MVGNSMIRTEKVYFVIIREKYCWRLVVYAKFDYV
jgi:hypothetical protein